MKHQNSASCNTVNRIVRDVALLFGLSLVAWAAVGGGLSGTVTDAKGAAISKAKVVAVSDAQGIQTKATTDAKGNYRFPTLAVGVYDLHVGAAGFKPSVRKMAIHVDDKLRLDIVLEMDTP
jgi:Carboxypeptidase regulatory-like domain